MPKPLRGHVIPERGAEAPGQPTARSPLLTRVGRRTPLECFDAIGRLQSVRVAVRKQYYFRRSERGLLAWDVDRLCDLSRHLPRKNVPLGDIRELDEPYGGEDAKLTWRQIAEHIQLINDADLSYPIILSADGHVMDGRHRVAKAAASGRDFIEAVQFETDPAPDYVGCSPDELPY